jgi:hypothetical protein
LKHAVGFLYAYGPGAVMAVGTAHTPNLTHFSILTLAGGKLSGIIDRQGFGSVEFAYQSSPRQTMRATAGNMHASKPTSNYS